MAAKFSPMVKETFASEPTERLVELWRSNDIHQYAPAAFAAINELLRERGITPPPQLPVPSPPAPIPPPGQKEARRGCLLMTLAMLLSPIAAYVFSFINLPPLRLLAGAWTSGLFLWGLVLLIFGVVSRLRSRSRG